MPIPPMTDGPDRIGLAPGFVQCQLEYTHLVTGSRLGEANDFQGLPMPRGWRPYLAPGTEADR